MDQEIRSIYPIIPIKVVSAITSTLVILITISLGGGAREVGYVVSLSFIGNLLGAIIWSRVISSRKAYVEGVLLGYLLLSIFTALLSIPNIYLVFISTFLIAFLTNLIYFSLLYFVIDNYKEGVEIGVGRLETIGGWSWVVGLIFGASAIDLIPLNSLISILSATLFTAIIFSIVLMVRDIKERIVEMVEEEEGLLPLIDKGINKIVDIEERLPDIIYSGIHVIYSGSLFFSPAYLNIRRPKRERLIHYIGVTLIFLTFGSVYTQLIKNIKDIGFSDSAIYIYSLMGSIFSALTYSKAGKGGRPIERFLGAGIIRTLIFTLLPLLIIIPYNITWIVLTVFYIISGVTWAYLIINLNLLSLRRGREEVGTANFFSNMGLFIGALISGYIVYTLDYFWLYVSSTILLITGIYLTYKANKVEEPSLKPIDLDSIRKLSRTFKLPNNVSKDIW